MMQLFLEQLWMTRTQFKKATSTIRVTECQIVMRCHERKYEVRLRVPLDWLIKSQSHFSVLSLFFACTSHSPFWSVKRTTCIFGVLCGLIKSHRTSSIFVGLFITLCTNSKWNILRKCGSFSNSCGQEWECNIFRGKYHFAQWWC